MAKREHWLTYDSTVGELYDNPVGHDALAKVLLQLGLPEKVLTNRVISGLTLRTIARLAKGKLGMDFFDSLLGLVELEKDKPCASKGKITPKWWKEAVFYQIYPRSFCDGNGDGTGDLLGIINKLDYLQRLGVDALWLSPIYDSPNDDNGYDIRDYDKIMEEFGTMEDFERLLAEVHKRGMRLIMDLVVNHTSDEHIWFKKASQGDPVYRDYYFFREDDKSHRPPNNWTSFFSGPAWKYEESAGSWALHLFSQKQMDLNWENPKVREEITAMVNRWLDKGVDGFRMDVINYISKVKGLPDGNETIGKLMGFTGMEHYGNNCWMSLFYNNHDNPRMISKITKDTSHHTALSKLLALMQLTLKGTPFLFQGDEMGLANYPFTSMEQITDVEAKGYYEEHIQKEPEGKVFSDILAGTREHARVPLPWNKRVPSCYAGLYQAPKREVFCAYRRLLRLRHEEKAFVYGSFRVLCRKKDRFVYARALEGRVYVVDCNLGRKSCRAFLLKGQWEVIYDTEKRGEKRRLRGYEARILRYGG